MGKIDLNYFEKVNIAADYLSERLKFVPRMAIILGTGYHNFIEQIEIIQTIEFSSIPHFLTPSVKSHNGKLYLCKVHNDNSSENCLVLSGRIHYYEGYSMKDVTIPMRVLGVLGIQHVILTNAAGSVNPDLEAGNIMILKDHINFQNDNPLRGENIDEWGPRFPDMSEVYHTNIRKSVLEFANREGIIVKEGVYLSVPGPNLETKAEYNFFNIIGADAIGMSTVPEVLVAKHMGMSVSALSIISNKCFPIEDISEVSLEDVIETVDRSVSKAIKVINFMISEIGKL